MAKFDEVISRIDTATNEIASDIQKLREQVTTGMTAEEVADVQSKLDAHASRLEQMGADPENPVPEPEPEEPAPVERKKR